MSDRTVVTAPPGASARAGRSPDLTWRAWTVWYRNYVVWKAFWQASLIGNLGEPILYLFAMGLGLGRMVGEVGGVPYLEFIAPGLVCSTAMYASSFECTFGAFTRMTRQRTYDAIVATPVSMDEIVAGEVLWGATKGLFSGGAMLAVMALFGLVRSPWGILTLPVSFLTGLLFAAVSMAVTAKSPSYDFFSYYFTLALAPLFLFSGIFFPVSELPAWAQTLARMLPLTLGVDVSRQLFTGTLSWSLLTDLAIVTTLSAGMFWVAVSWIRKRMIV